jgi:hypothetical protein
MGQARAEGDGEGRVGAEGREVGRAGGRKVGRAEGRKGGRLKGRQVGMDGVGARARRRHDEEPGPTIWIASLELKAHVPVNSAVLRRERRPGATGGRGAFVG